MRVNHKHIYRPSYKAEGGVLSFYQGYHILLRTFLSCYASLESQHNRIIYKGHLAIVPQSSLKILVCQELPWGHLCN